MITARGVAWYSKLIYILIVCPHSGSVTPADPVTPAGAVMTSRVLMRQELMRQQAQDQERREAQKQACSAQQRPTDATPAISVASTLPATPTQVPVEVLKV